MNGGTDVDTNASPDESRPPELTQSEQAAAADLKGRKSGAEAKLSEADAVCRLSPMALL